LIHFQVKNYFEKHLAPQSQTLKYDLKKKLITYRVTAVDVDPIDYWQRI
jgi:hypothetical protein